ncbi:MAG: hypothetical protein AYK23_01620 [Candidatus Proteinoplasmatales archaeon SG8-5]|nr:MAG: hypothetical protein AYK23_01620 [Candidatus Proteinoplasmatales archaeon SG8-5]
MKRTAVAAAVTVFFILSIVGGLFAILAEVEVEGFVASDLHAPGSFTASPLEDVPAVQGDVQTTPDVSLTISIGQVYKDYGGSIRLSIANNGSRQLFVVEVGFEWVGSLVENVHQVHEELHPGETVEVRAMDIDGPYYSGEQDYRMKIRVLQHRAQGWFRVTSGGDDWLDFPTHTTSVSSMTPAGAFTLDRNNPHYFDKANGLIDYDEPTVLQATNEAVAGLGSGYHIGKACAIFDYVDRTIVYTDDPTEDLWYEPEVCLLNRAGDCEDYSLLIATMVHHAGGTARMYLTEGHAFAAIFVGNSTAELQQAAVGVRSYYGSDVKLMAFHDETGYWMFADPLGSFHFGGLAVGAVPSADTALDLNATFEDTANVYTVDITGVAASLTLLGNPIFWIFLVITLGIVDISVILWAAADKHKPQRCLVCDNDTHPEHHYECKCGQRYHHTCLPSQSFCLNCGTPIEAAPPLPPTRPMH